MNIDVERSPKQDLDIKFGLDRYPGYRTGDLPYFRRIQPVIWQLFEEPRSSKAASVNISHFLILISILIKFEIIQMKNQLNNYCEIHELLINNVF